MEPVEELLAIEAIRQLKARYFRCMDTKDWEGLAQVFASDAVLDHTEAEMNHTVTGRQEIADSIRKAVAEVTTVHHGHMAEIEILSPTEARGVWAMEDMLWWPEGGPTQAMHGYGHYHEEYRFEDGAWRISLNRLTRLRLDFTR
ncbi:MAG: nuclear transport factor 2 family protein [Myxococcota bacterium]